MRGTTLGQWLELSPFTLVMSSGFFGFFAHTGMLLAIRQAGLTINGVSGSSAGALVGGLHGAGLSALEIKEELTQLRREDFWDPGLGMGLLRGKLFHQKLQNLLPVTNFDECPIPVNVSVFDLRTRKTEAINKGDLASAIHASCAVPLLFQPVKRSGKLLWDGGVSDRPGFFGLNGDTGGQTTRTFYHHIASRSPWRRPQSPSLQIPQRDATVTLRIFNLPRANPFRLKEGVLAMNLAYEATQRALDEPIVGSVVDVTARRPDPK